MEKKFKFSDKSAVSKIVYLTVIAILCVSAIVIGIVAANSRKKNDTDNPPAVDGGSDTDGSTDGSTNGSTNGSNGSGSDNNTDGGNNSGNTETTYISPLSGTVMKSHSTTVPVFSNTMDEWRIHTGLDICCDDGAEVYASANGEVTAVYKDPMLGNTVEITHTSGIKTCYSNLDADAICVNVGDTVSQGDLIACVGDTTIIEIADEPHLHFEIKVNDESVNPLDYLTEESKKTSLGIVSGSEDESESGSEV